MLREALYVVLSAKVLNRNDEVTKPTGCDRAIWPATCAPYQCSRDPRRYTNTHSSTSSVLAHSLFILPSPFAFPYFLLILSLSHSHTLTPCYIFFYRLFCLFMLSIFRSLLLSCFRKILRPSLFLFLRPILVFLISSFCTFLSIPRTWLNFASLFLVF